MEDRRRNATAGVFFFLIGILECLSWYFHWWPLKLHDVKYLYQMLRLRERWFKYLMEVYSGLVYSPKVEVRVLSIKVKVVGCSKVLTQTVAEVLNYDKIYVFFFFFWSVKREKAKKMSKNLLLIFFIIRNRCGKKIVIYVKIMLTLVST